MTDLVVRRLLVDLEAPFAVHWCGGDAFRTALLRRAVDELPGRRTVLHRLGARRRRRRCRPIGRRASTRRSAASSARRRRTVGCTPSSTAISRRRASSTAGVRARPKRLKRMRRQGPAPRGRDDRRVRALHRDPRRVDAARTRTCSTAARNGCRRCGCGTRPRSASTRASRSTSIARSAATTRGGCAGSGASRCMFVTDALRQTVSTTCRRTGPAVALAHVGERGHAAVRSPRARARDRTARGARIAARASIRCSRTARARWTGSRRTASRYRPLGAD